MTDDERNTFETTAIIVGDAKCGKTSLAAAFLDKVFPTKLAMPMYEFDARQATVEADGQITRLILRDSSVLEHYERLKPLAYCNASVAVICFGVDNPKSLKSVMKKWYADIVQYAPGLPIILVGLKLDLRDDPTTIESLAKAGVLPVSEVDGRRVARRIGAETYIECSALDNRNIRRVFECAAQAALVPRAERHVDALVSDNKCVIQ